MPSVTPIASLPLFSPAASTGTAYDIDWLTVHAGRFFPAEWQLLRDHIPSELRGLRLVDAYNTLFHGPRACSSRGCCGGVVSMGGRSCGQHRGRHTEPPLRRRNDPPRLRPASHPLLVPRLMAHPRRNRH